MVICMVSAVYRQTLEERYLLWPRKVASFSWGGSQKRCLLLLSSFVGLLRFGLKLVPAGSLGIHRHDIDSTNFFGALIHWVVFRPPCKFALAIAGSGRMGRVRRRRRVMMRSRNRWRKERGQRWQERGGGKG